ncbi:uncharacterized protein LOC124162242 [Ischnura elegans]|uniref:uncharacterized protein LOC124162242 n=1 Tax=Ischnura elegans TaxID=197161 RepID=UPI001ED8A48B|nr:uncharacterized protein LOC124162242 [Ischnura elegans]
MGAAWKIVLVVFMVVALAAAMPSPDEEQLRGDLPAEPVEDSPARATFEDPGPVNPKRPPNKKVDSVAETRSETDRTSNGGFFEDIFNIPIKVLEAVRDLIQNRGQYYGKNKVNEDVVPSGVRRDEPVAPPSTK